MKTHQVRCPYCQQWFTPSRFRPSQTVCSRPDCQRQRANDYHRQKKRQDPLYHQQCRDSQKQWRQAHPHYMPQYRQTHPDSLEQNRRRARQRYRKRRAALLVKNNLALDLKAASSEVFLIGPSLEPFVKNNLAFSQVYIFQQPG